MTVSKRKPRSKTVDKDALLRGLAELSHAALAVAITANLEKCLFGSLTTAMPNLSGGVQSKLFEGYGALATLSAKIDLAYAMGLINQDLRRDLHVIREIRNAFAHTNALIHFNNEIIVKKLKKFSDFEESKDNIYFFFEK